MAKALVYGFIKLYESLCLHHLRSILKCFGNHFSIHLYIFPSVIAVIKVHSGVKNQANLCFFCGVFKVT